MFKTQVEPRVAGQRVVSLQSFENFMVSFLWFIRVQSIENCGRFVKYSNILQNSTGAFYAWVKAY